MTLKEELEILRGEPIQVFTGDPMDIPCIETSDPEKLCKNPVVSVHMITYNHEPYIRQAIEGVMMQKTDFEFELVIGEDASTDKTREICFEYQKRYPDKIRVLWWHENLYRNPHPAGGNSARNRAHCRGEFIAFCEGDDYWTDPLKLQKQLDAMTKMPNVGMCFTDGLIYNNEAKTYDDWITKYNSGIISGRTFFESRMFGEHGRVSWFHNIPTPSVMIRKSILEEARNTYEVFNWGLIMGDVITWLGVSLKSDVYKIPEKCVCYRRHAGGVTSLVGQKILLDGYLNRIYFAQVAFRKNNDYKFKIQVTLNDLLPIFYWNSITKGLNQRMLSHALIGFFMRFCSHWNFVIWIPFLLMNCNLLNRFNLRVLLKIAKILSW